MPVDILVPEISPGIETVTLLRWLKTKGERVRPGDPIVEIETDKATMEVEASVGGILADILVPDGATEVPVNTSIGTLVQVEEDGIAGEHNQPSPALPCLVEAVAIQPTSACASTVGIERGARLFASPLAKRRAREIGIDLTALTGTGPNGRIIEQNVLQAAQAKLSVLSTPNIPNRETGVEKGVYAPGSFVETPHSSMRKAIAGRLSESKRTIPHFYLRADCELDALISFREQLNATASVSSDGEVAYKTTINDFLIKALAMALQHVPDANVTWTERCLLKHQHADIAIAVAVPGGLFTPVIQQANLKSISRISNEVKALAARAHNRTLKLEELQGGSSTVSNLGMYGVQEFSAIINPPHATILAAGSAKKRAIVKEGNIVVATLMSCTLSVDHRAIDGAVGAELLAAFRKYVENPMFMFL